MTHAERRASPRLEVVDQLYGQLVALNVPLHLRDLSPGGFSADAPIAFPEGAAHQFRFITAQGVQVILQATAVYSRSMSNDPRAPRYVTGFAFVQDGSAETLVSINVLLDAMLDMLRLVEDEPLSNPATSREMY